MLLKLNVLLNYQGTRRDLLKQINVIKKGFNLRGAVSMGLEMQVSL